MKHLDPFFKQYKTIFVVGSIAIVAVCCKTTHPVSSATTTSAITSPLDPVKSDLAIAQTHWPGTTLNNLEQGYSIFEDKCTHCHRAKRPQDFALNEWNVIMRKMGRKAKLDSDQYRLVFHYILTKREAILGTSK